MHIFSRIIYEDLKETFVCLYICNSKKKISDERL